MNTKLKTATSLILGAGIGIALICGVAASNTATEPNLPPCATEDSLNCYWDAASRGNGLGESFVNLDGYTYYESGEIVQSNDPTEITTPTPTLTPQPKPEPKPTLIPVPEPVSTTPSPNGPKADWDLGTLECGINAKPAIDQDGYGNWWAYCEPALID